MSLNIAILGPGKIADRFLAPAIAQVPSVRLWSVLSRDMNRARDFAVRHGAASPSPAYTDIDGLLADRDLHAVLIASPDGLHAEQAVRAARAGRHVLVEKPMATSLEGSRAMVEACRKAGVRLGVAYHLRWHAGHRRLLERVRTGDLGDVRHMRVQWTYRTLDASNWRAADDVGRWWALAGVGTHCLDMIRWFMRPGSGEIAEVRSLITRAVWKGPHDETSLVLLRFESGATAEIAASVLFDSETTVEVFGSLNRAICRGTLGPLGQGHIRIGEQDLPFEPVNPYAGEIADFAAAVREGRPPEVDGGEGLRNVEILLAADPRA